MSKTEYQHNKNEAFKINCINRNDKRYNIHHDYFRYDLKKHLIPSNFPINDKSNLTVLPIETHEKLHWIIENDIQYRDIRLRKYMSNMAFNGELDLIPQKIFYSKLMVSP